MLGDKDQIQDIDRTIAVGVGRGLAEPVRYLHQIQDVNRTIAVDIDKPFCREIDLAIEVGELVGQFFVGKSPFQEVVLKVVLCTTICMRFQKIIR